MTRLSLFCLHLLARLVLWIHLSVCLPLFVCRHHLPAFLFFFFFKVKRAALFCVFGPFAMFAPLTPPFRIHAFHYGTNFFFFFIHTRRFEKNWSDADSNVDVFRKLRAYLLTYLCSELPEPRRLDEVNSVLLETFFKCNTFRDMHNWWVHDEWLHLRVTQINPCDYETTQEGDYGKADTDEHNCTSKQRLQCSQILRKQACMC